MARPERARHFDQSGGGGATPPPDAPVLSIDSYPSTTSVVIEWTEPAGTPTSYNVYLDGVLFSNVAAPTLTETVTGLSLGVDADIHVTAVGAGGESDPSNTVTANTYAFYYLYDTFTGSNGTALSAHTPEQGGPWTNTGVLEIQSNKAKFLSLAATRNYAFAIAPRTTADGYMQAGLTIVGTGDYGIVINVQDVDHLWLLWFTGGNVVLYEETAKHAFTSRGSYATTPATMKLVANGDTIEGWLDGVLRITYTTASRPYKSSAACGLMVFGTSPSGSSFDNALAGA